MKATPVVPLRRSTRVQLRIPVTLSGMLAEGGTFTEDTYVISVSKFGARVKTRHALKPGTEVRVRPHAKPDDARFRVVWAGRQGTPRAGEIGVEYVEVSNMLGVAFPE